MQKVYSGHTISVSQAGRLFLFLMSQFVDFILNHEEHVLCRVVVTLKGSHVSITSPLSPLHCQLPAVVSVQVSPVELLVHIEAGNIPLTTVCAAGHQVLLQVLKKPADHLWSSQDFKQNVQKDHTVDQWIVFIVQTSVGTRPHILENIHQMFKCPPNHPRVSIGLYLSPCKVNKRSRILYCCHTVTMTEKLSPQKHL